MNTTNDRISEEAHGNIGNFLAEPIFYDDFGFDLQCGDPLDTISISGTCDFSLPDSTYTCSAVEPSEFINAYLGPQLLSPTSSIESDNKRALISNSPIHLAALQTKVQRRQAPLPLSQSVGVGEPQQIINATQKKIAIVNDLEEWFRPRYKSDYFAQNGNSRKPRYVADRKGNHFVTLKVPVGVPGKILVHWLTIPDKSGERYIMPYRFQESNESINVPDCNPLRLDIKADKNGFMRLYLVLIKSKQDELKTAQPLQVFQPLREAFNMPIKQSQTFCNPKQLIHEYQLDQSQLAFTFCGLSADGTTFVPEWDTTVLSTVLREVSTENTKSRTVSCPNCQHQFEASFTVEQEYVPESNTKKRKYKQTSANKKIKAEPSMPYVFEDVFAS